MKLGLIGANSNVGTELCFLLRNSVELIPIVRNKIGSLFLNYHNFDCRISDMSNEHDASAALNDLDASNSEGNAHNLQLNSAGLCPGRVRT